MIVPLKKSTVGGVLYTRLPEIEARLVALSMLSENVLVVQCGQSKSHSQYVPSECLLYFVRRSASTNPALFDRLFRLLSERILMNLPRAEDAGGKTVSLTNSDIRETVYDRFIELLVVDKAGYEERLDPPRHQRGLDQPERNDHFQDAQQVRKNHPQPAEEGVRAS